MGVAAICLSARDEGAHGDLSRFMASLVGRITIAAREAGWKGHHLTHFDFDAGPPAAATIQIGPGQTELTVERLRQALKDRQRAAK